MGIPDSEIAIDEALIHELIAAQVPEMADQPVEIVGNGWDNVTARIGPEHAARLPRRAVAVELLRNEQRWLPIVAPMLEVPIPEPTHIGIAGEGYPWPWSVVPWMDGTTAEHAPLNGLAAASYGRFLAALHIAAPEEAPRNPYRGTPLRDHDERVRARWTALRNDHPQVASLCGPALEIWDRGIAAPEATEATWVHGDLHPRNIVSSGGALAGVIDWGDINGGDPATDLASVWMQFSADHHDEVWAAYGTVGTALRLRARAWAIAFAGILISTGFDDDPGFLALGTLIANRAIEAD